MSIGLKRGSVRLEPHHKEWADLFEQQKARLKAALEMQVIDIQHVGSTAVPGIAAKPMLDMLIGLSDLTHETAMRPLLESLDYYLSWRTGRCRAHSLRQRGRVKPHPSSPCCDVWKPILAGANLL